MVFDEAWKIVKEDMAKERAAGLDKCCDASGLSMQECKNLIESMNNVKIHPDGDVILTEGL
jgi:hypothetical protein